MGRLSNLLTSATDPASGWDARLWRLWAFYTALAYTLILGIILILTSLGLHVTKVALDYRFIGTLLIATFGSVLYGGFLGALQWRVLRERVPMPRRDWVKAAVIPGLVVWIGIVVPAGIAAENSGHDIRISYFLAISQALALGPLIGFSQAVALRPYTRRWKWWIAANLVSWLIVQVVFYVVSLIFGAFDFAHGNGSPLEAYLLLIAATPLSGRWMLWVTAPDATVLVTEPGVSTATAGAPTQPRLRRTRPEAPA
jgi:hypothetical protein